MNKKRIINLMMAAGLLFSAAPVLAQSAPSPVGLRGDVKVEKTMVENGTMKTVLADTSLVVPGDHLLFTTYYVNNGTAPVQNFVVTNALPKPVVLAPESAATLNVSVDGGKTWGPLASRTVDDGKGGQRAAEAADVTHVRWTIPTIAPHGDGKVEYRAIVR